METIVPILVLASGEIFLALVAARVVVWVWRGWREGRGGPRGPGGPGGGLRVLRGGASRAAERPAPAPLRRAA